ncbi:MAG: hypothetical protein U0821_22030 [Chloroflexota bacterium]
MAELTPKQHDVTTRFLVRQDPAAWVQWLGLPGGAPTQVLDSNLSLIQAEVDSAIRIDAAVPWIAHLEFQTGRDRDLPARVDLYNYLLGHRHGLPVVSTVVLLRPQAFGAELSGVLESSAPDGEVIRHFRYRVLQAWALPEGVFLEGGPAILPLAPIPAMFARGLRATERAAGVRMVLHEMSKRVVGQLSQADERAMWTATQVVLGLRYSRTEAARFFPEVRAMRDSSVYQAIAEEERVVGRMIEARQMLLDLGSQRFGNPDAAVSARVEQIRDLSSLQRRLHRVLQATSWDDLLRD